LAFNTVIFLATLWALSTEMVEDSLVDLVYGHMYGWRTLVYALVTAFVILIVVSAVSVYYALTLLIQYVGLGHEGLSYSDRADRIVLVRIFNLRNSEE
jgi:uncharacterized membrane protein